MLTWLDYVCRKEGTFAATERHSEDPRMIFAQMLGSLVRSAQTGRRPFNDFLDEAF